jgi:type III pantothenate kinase
MKTRWLALVIGNSRLHWAHFVDQQLLQVWHSPLSEFKGFHQRSPQDWTEWQAFLPPFPAEASEKFPDFPYPELWLVSVVPSQSEFWSVYPNLNLPQLSDVPLQAVYSGLGLDRAIAVWGAGITYGWPCLAIDGGTALTLTGADANASLVGGAILPGLALQFRTLSSSTAALGLVELPQELPALWGKDTETAIQSGIVHAAIAGIRHAIQQWLNAYPTSKVVFTGGDAKQLSTYVRDWMRQYEEPEQESDYLVVDPTLAFSGIRALRKEMLNKALPKSKLIE